MSCNYDQRFRLWRKLATVVANGTAGAAGVLGDNVKLVVPTPKLQCQISLVCVPDVPTMGLAGNFNFKANAGNCLWWLQPILPIGDVARSVDFTNVSTQLIGRTDSVIGGGSPNYSPLGVTYPSDLAGPQSFVIADANPLWLAYVSLFVALTNGGVPSGYVAVFADFTPAPGYPVMSPEEWQYWVRRCELTPQIGSEKFLLQVT